MSDFGQIHARLLARYDLEGLRTLCAQLDVDFDDLRGEGRSGKARELILLLRRTDRLDDLLSVLEMEPATSAPADGRALAPPRRRPARPPTGPIRNRWALLVGINRYIDPAFPDLRFCVNDVLALERRLTALGYTVVALHDRAAEERLLPTRDNFEGELGRLCETAGEDDLLWVHFAGHGLLVDGRPALVTREMRSYPLHNNPRYPLFLDDVERMMRESRARRLVLTLDACHVGVEMGRDLADPEFIRHAYELAEGFVLLAASTAQQRAQEWEAEEHGVFTYYLLEGLSGRADRAGKGFVTADDLKTHTLDGLRRWNITHGGLLQEPTARIEGLGDIVLADLRPPAVNVRPLTVHPNPFGYTGRIEDPALFFDRERLLDKIFDRLSKGVSISLVGEAQVGKSSILAMVVKPLGPERLHLPPETFSYLSLEWVENEEEFYEALGDALKLGAPLRGYKLTRALRGRRHILALDEMEKMAWEGFTKQVRGQLRGLADGPSAPLTLIVASRSPLGQIFPDAPELDSPLAGLCQPLEVGPFPPPVARAFLSERLRGTGVVFTAEEIERLVAESGGHPGRLQHLAAEMYDDHVRRAAM